MSKRSLAHIEQIISLEPIENSDFLEKATILGWHVVVKKDEFNVSDKVIYIDTGVAKGKFDFLIAEHFKDGDYIRPVFCDSSDIDII